MHFVSYRCNYSGQFSWDVEILYIKIRNSIQYFTMYLTGVTLVMPGLC